MELERQSKMNVTEQQSFSKFFSSYFCRHVLSQLLNEEFPIFPQELICTENVYAQLNS